MTRGRHLALVALALASAALAAWAVWTVTLAPRPSPDAPSPDPTEGPHPAGIPGLAARPAEAGGMGVSAKEGRAAATVTVTGHVLTEDRSPIAGATVVAVPSWEDLESAPFRDDLPRATTTADGAFRLAPAVIQIVLAWADGYVAKGESFVGAGVPLEIALRREAGRIAGTVRDEAGKPIAGAWVTAGDWWKGLGFAVTGADGTYSVARRGEDQVHVAAWAQGYATGTGNAPRGGDRVDIVLPRAIAVRGRVVDASTNVGLVGASVEGESDFTPPVTSSTDGAFDAFVHPETKHLRASAEGYSEGRGEIVRAANGAGSVEIRLDPFIEYSGVVFDENGQPLPGASVHAIRGGRTTSDADGRFRVAGPEPGRTDWPVVGLVATAGERTPGLAFVEAAEREGIVLRMGAPAPLVGQVVDEHDVPRSGARVHVRTSGGAAWKKGVNPLEARVARGEPLVTDADGEGRFRVMGLAEGDYTLYARATPTAKWYVTAKARVAAGAATEVRIVLPDGIAFSGVVVDDTGAPVPDATVSMTPPHAALEERSVETDAEGRFRFEGAPDRPVSVHAHASGFEGWGGDVDPHDGETRIVLRRHRGIRWRFRLEGEVPPEGSLVRIEIRPVRGGSACSKEVRVVDGRATVEWAAVPGEYEADLAGEDRYSDRVRVEAKAVGGDVFGTLRLHSAVSVSGVVRGPDGDGLPAASVTVWDGSRHHRAVADSEGRFVVRNLRPGTVRLTATHAGLGMASVEVEAGRQDVEMRLAALPKPGASVPAPASPSGLTISGRVLDASGRPPEHGTITATSGAGAGQLTAFAQADETGRFTLSGLAPGTWRLVVHGDGAHATVEAVAGTQGLEVRLIANGQIRGRVQAPGVREFEALQVVANFDRGGTYSGRVQPDGRFAFEQAPPGTYRLSARAGPLVGWRANPVEVAPGQIVRDVILDLVPGGVIEGRILSAAGAPVVGAEVSAHNAGAPYPGGVQTDAQGRFRIEGLVSGSWHLFVHGGGLAQGIQRTVEAQEGRAVTLELSPTR